MDLKGFRWGTVDKVIHGLQATVDAESDTPAKHPSDERPEAEQEFLAADVAPSQTFQRAAAEPPTQAPQAPAQSETQAPQTSTQPQVKATLPAQLTAQLIPEKANPPPGFPLAQFQGAYAGNGFNMIFRPLSSSDPPPPIDEFKRFIFKTPTSGPRDNVLELNLTTEQLTFGPTIGDIPNRGLSGQRDIHLAGLPYMQTVQDVTNPISGLGDRVGEPAIGIHFEPGMWLTVPQADHNSGPSVVRMASIPHGTTINAQGLVPSKGTGTTAIGGVTAKPKFDVLNTTPFNTEDNTPISFPSMNALNQNTWRVPQNLEKFNENGTKRITTEIIKNPNKVLENAIQGLDITETITFEVSTGSSDLNGGGTANISFLAGKQAAGITDAPGIKDFPIAHAVNMKAKYWIERVSYQVNLPPTITNDARDKNGNVIKTRATLLVKPTMPPNSTAPTPQFLVTTPPGGVPQGAKIKVPGIQIQSSQTVNLNFGPSPPPGPSLAPFLLTWPHVSVATLVPVDPQPFQMN